MLCLVVATAGLAWQLTGLTDHHIGWATSATRRRGVSLAAMSPEEEARKRMLASLGGEPAWKRGSADNRASTEDAIASTQRLRQEARQRMLDAMGGSNPNLRRGAGMAFGYGAEDDEDYGYGPRRRREPEIVIDPATGKPVDFDKSMDDDFRRGGGMHWSRKAEVINPNPPPMADTLRSPGQARERAEAHFQALEAEEAALAAALDADDSTLDAILNSLKDSNGSG